MLSYTISCLFIIFYFSSRNQHFLKQFTFPQPGIIRLLFVREPQFIFLKIPFIFGDLFDMVLLILGQPDFLVSKLRPHMQVHGLSREYREVVKFSRESSSGILHLDIDFEILDREKVLSAELVWLGFVLGGINFQPLKWIDIFVQDPDF